MSPNAIIAIFFVNGLIGLSGKRTMAFYIAAASYLVMDAAYTQAVIDGVSEPINTVLFQAIGASIILWSPVWFTDFVKSAR